jgi:hypothetical protein
VKRTSEYVSYGLIAAALGLTIVAVVDRDRPTTKEQSARAGLLLRVFRPDDITRITLDRRLPANEKIEIVREGDAWKLTSPRPARADFLAVTSFLNALQGARADRSLGIVQGSERAQLGLDAPRARVEIAMKGVILKLALGAAATGAQETDAGARSSYVEVGPYGDEKGGVYVVPPDVAAALDRTFDSFREPSLLGGQQSPTFAKIDVAGKVSLARAPNGSWRLPNGTRAAADAVDGLLIALYEMKAGPFLPDNTPIDVSKGGSVEITQLDGKKLSLTFGGACPSDPKQVVAKSESTGCVPSVVTDRILSPESAYVDTRAFWLQPGSETAKVSEIESITIESAGAKVLDGERRGDGLHLRVPNDEQIDNASMDRYFGRLAAIAGTIVDKPDLAALGLSPAAGRAILKRRVSAAMVGATDGGSQLVEQVVEVGTPGKEGIHLRRVDDGVVLKVPLELAQPLRAAAAHELRSPNLIAATADSIIRVHVKPEGSVAFDMNRKGGLWELTAPPGFGADASTAGSITSTLATLLCLRWAADKDDGSFGFDKPSVVIDVERDKENFTIELGRESTDANGGIYARIKGRDPICVLPIGKRDSLLKPPVDYRNVGFDPTVTPRITIVRDKRQRILQFNDVTKAWTDASDAGTDFVARKLADAVRGLRAEALVHLGPALKEEGFDAPYLTITGADATSTKKKLIVGAPGKVNDVSIHYVRIEGLDATWAVLRGDIDAISALL